MKRWLADSFGAYKRHPVPAIGMLLVLILAVITAGTAYAIRSTGHPVTPVQTVISQPAKGQPRSKPASAPGPVSTISVSHGPLPSGLKVHSPPSAPRTPLAPLPYTRPSPDRSSLSPAATVSASAVPEPSASPEPAPTDSAMPIATATPTTTAPPEGSPT